MYHEAVNGRVVLALSLLTLGASSCQLVFGLDQYGPATGTGGSSGGSGPSQTSSASGPSSCCVQSTPQYQLVEVTTAPGTSPAPVPCADPQRFFGGAPPTDTCSGCACDTNAAVCHATIGCYTADGCAGGVVTHDLVGSSMCALTNGIAGTKSCQFTTAPTAMTGAAPTGGTVSPGTWETQFALCPVTGTPSGCDTGQTCPQSSAGTRLCLLATTGASSCPAGFDDLIKVHAGGVDNQQCNCTCDTSCSFSVDLALGCGILGSVPLSATQCTTGMNYSYVPTQMVTATPHDAITGTFDPDPPATLCCKKI